MRVGPILCVLILPFALAAAEFTCPVTKAPDPPFVPPAPYEVAPDADAFWFGTTQLWTDLPRDGVWEGLPYEKGQGYTNKLFLWQVGFDGMRDPTPDLIVVTQRLDAKAPLLSRYGGTTALFPGANAMLTGVNFPTAGCWAVNAYHAGAKLRFVLSIQP